MIQTKFCLKTDLTKYAHTAKKLLFNSHFLHEGARGLLDVPNSSKYLLRFLSNQHNSHDSIAGDHFVSFGGEKRSLYSLQYSLLYYT